MKKQTITPASEWKARATGEIVTLPSGTVVRVRRPSLFALARTGSIPNPLAAAVVRFFAVTDETPTTSEQDQIKNYQANADAYTGIAAATVTEPRIIVDRAPDYDAGEIAPEDLSTADLIWIYRFVEGAVSNDATFQQPEIATAGE